MKSFGKSTVSEFLSDQIVFRNLIPFDPRLPGLPELQQKLNFPKNFLPRKAMPEYGQVLAEIIKASRQASLPNTPLHRIIYIGDTLMNDGQAFHNICSASGLGGAAFIGSDRPGPLQIQLNNNGSSVVYTASRWKALEQFDAFLEESSSIVDEHAAVLFDLDKTILGARGRNDQVIDMKRLKAAEDTLSEALGDTFTPEHFKDAYHALNQVEFHPFTADNQDYIVYICLIVSSGLIPLADLIFKVRNDKHPQFQDFIAYVEGRKLSLPVRVRAIHTDVYRRVQSGDPTPFKAFRYNEFKRTIENMGCLPDSASIEQILANEIVITGEIREAANRWKTQGALLFGLSDKPDEAILPTRELAAQGNLPVHQTPTHVIGEE